jgi:hypothetical protein
LTRAVELPTVLRALDIAFAADALRQRGTPMTAKIAEAVRCSGFVAEQHKIVGQYSYPFWAVADFISNGSRIPVIDKHR